MRSPVEKTVRFCYTPRWQLSGLLGRCFGLELARRGAGVGFGLGVGLLRLVLVLFHDRLDLRLSLRMLGLVRRLRLGLGLCLCLCDRLALLLGRQLAALGPDREPQRRRPVWDELERDRG